MTRVLDAARQLRATASQRAEAYQIETDRELKGAGHAPVPEVAEDEDEAAADAEAKAATLI